MPFLLCTLVVLVNSECSTHSNEEDCLKDTSCQVVYSYSCTGDSSYITQWYNISTVDEATCNTATEYTDFSAEWKDGKCRVKVDGDTG